MLFPSYVPTPGIMTFILLVDPKILDHHYYILSLSDQCPWVEKTSILQFLAPYFPPWDGRSENIQFLVFLLYRCNLIKIGRAVLEKTIWTDNAQWTTTHSNESPLVSDSGDLKLPVQRPSVPSIGPTFAVFHWWKPLHRGSDVKQYI